MTLPRICVHTDGRWALLDHRAGDWWVSDPDVPGPPPMLVPWSYLSGDPAWREWPVVELPEPDKEWVTALDVRKARFGRIEVSAHPGLGGPGWSMTNGLCGWDDSERVDADVAGLLAAKAWAERQGGDPQ